MFVGKLIWEEWNVDHIARHDVTANEVEEVCAGEHITLKGHSKRIILCGRTKDGRLISIVLGHEGKGVYYPITARDASKKERQYWRKDKGVQKP